MVPTPIYEMLPYVYVFLGALAVVGIDAMFAKVCGLMLIAVGIVIYQARRTYRYQKLRLNDFKNGKTHARKAGKQDITKSSQDFQRGEACYKRGDYQDAFKWYRKAAEQGHSAAQVNLGAMYAEGRGVARNFQEALLWYHQAAQQGEALACFNLGVMYVEGQGVDRDFQEALKWYRQAAAQGHILAQFEMGLLYEQNSDALSLKEAVNWYQKAAEKGYAPAQVNLGAMYAEGRGVALELHEAQRWYQAAAQQDYAPGQFNLGVMYFQGYDDIPRDLTMACLWFARAARQGDREAEHMRNRAEGHLTTQQRTQVRELLEATPSDQAA